MPQGLLTSLLLKLTIEYWYFTLLAILLKFFFLRLTATETFLRAAVILFIGSSAFFTIACLAGLIFSSMSYVSTGMIMVILAFSGEMLFCTIMFRTAPRKLIPGFAVGNGLFLIFLYMEAMSLGFL
jgi:hypothetical protein